MIIRHANKSDMPEMITLYNMVAELHATYHPLYEEIANPGKIAITNYIDNPNSISLIAEKKGKVIGFIGAMYRTMPKTFKNRMTLHITDLVVHPNHRIQGVATQLLKKIISIAKENEIRYVTLDVAVKNYIALQLYRKVGFEELSINMVYDNGDE